MPVIRPTSLIVHVVTTRMTHSLTAPDCCLSLSRQNRLEWLAVVLIQTTLTCSIGGTKANHMAYAPQYVSTT